MTVAGWVVLGVVGVLLVWAAFLALRYRREGDVMARHLDMRIWELQARVDNLETAVAASISDSIATARSSDEKRPGRQESSLSPDLRRALAEGSRGKRDEDLPNFHD